MKRKPRITTFAKLVIAVLIFFGLRYAYLHREEILSSDFFSLPDTTDQPIDTIDSTQTIMETSDSVESESIPMLTDTLEIKLIKKDSILLINVSGTSVSISLNDSLLNGDTIPIEALANLHVYGSVIIQ